MNQKSLLFINRVYPPVEGATGQLLSELAPELVRAGWKVTVLTCAPCDVAPRTETVEGVSVVRVAGLPFTRASHWRRALSYLSLYPALLWRAWRLSRADVVVTVTDPPLQVLMGPALKWLKRSRVVHWAQDLYPELAEELGVLSRGGIPATVLRRLSTWALQRCDAVIPVGRCMAERLQARGLPPELIEVIPNWGHGGPGEPRLHREENPFRREHQFAGRFVVMYSGNLGLAHPFEAILDAAEQLAIDEPRALLVFVGSGPRLAWVQEQVRTRRLDNVRFLPFQPRERLAESLTSADVHLASMLDHLCGLVVPSKVYGVLGAGRPCIFLGPAASEAARLIREQDCGEVLDQPDGEKLAACLRRWIQRQSDPAQRSALPRGASAAAAVMLAPALRRFDEMFHRVLEGAAETCPADMPQPLGISPPVTPGRMPGSTAGRMPAATGAAFVRAMNERFR